MIPSQMLKGTLEGCIMAVISRLRKKLEPDPAAPKYIQTIKGVGYRFSREV